MYTYCIGNSSGISRIRTLCGWIGWASSVGLALQLGPVGDVAGLLHARGNRREEGEFASELFFDLAHREDVLLQGRDRAGRLSSEVLREPEADGHQFVGRTLLDRFACGAAPGAEEDLVPGRGDDARLRFGGLGGTARGVVADVVVVFVVASHHGVDRVGAVPVVGHQLLDGAPVVVVEVTLGGDVGGVEGLYVQFAVGAAPV